VPTKSKSDQYTGLFNSHVDKLKDNFCNG